MPSPRLPEVGDTIAGKYRLLRSLGEGGMGVVFEAVHVRLGQYVAVKIVHPRAMASDDVVMRFEREARAASQIRSANVAKVIDVDTTDDGLPCMVMELLQGHDLSVELEERLNLPIGDAIDFILQACAGMDEAHALGIVHRDLKPSNLFVCEEGGRRTVKVLDFGISKIEEAASSMTQTQCSMGTPLYMSPEQVRSAKHVDARSDVWSLGVILYELLAGERPFDGSTTAVAAAIVADKPAPLRSRRGDVPEELESAVMKALAKNPDERFLDVRAFASALAPYGAPESSRWTFAMPLSRSRPDVKALDVSSLNGPGSVSKPRIAMLADAPRVHPADVVTAPPWSTRSIRAREDVTESTPPKAKARDRRVAIAAGAVTLALAVALLFARKPHDAAPSAAASSSPAPERAVAFAEPVQPLAVAPVAAPIDPPVVATNATAPVAKPPAKPAVIAPAAKPASKAAPIPSVPVSTPARPSAPARPTGDSPLHL